MCNCAFLAAVVMPVVVAPVRVVPVAVASLPVLRGALVSVVMAAVVVVVTVSLAGRGAVRGLRAGKVQRIIMCPRCLHIGRSKTMRACGNVSDKFDD